jgi:hypothetical protein
MDSYSPRKSIRISPKFDPAVSMTPRDQMAGSCKANKKKPTRSEIRGIIKNIIRQYLAVLFFELIYLSF